MAVFIVSGEVGAPETVNAGNKYCFHIPYYNYILRDNHEEIKAHQYLFKIDSSIFQLEKT